MVTTTSQIPRLVYENLSRPDALPALHEELRLLRQSQQQNNRLLAALCAVLGVAVVVALWALVR